MSRKAVQMPFMFLVLLMLVVSSACVSNDPVEVEEVEEKEVADVITIEKIDTLPSSPILTNRNFKLYVTLKNNDKKRTIENAYVDIYDPSIFYISGAKGVSSGTILPLGEKVVILNLTTPGSQRIANVETEAELKFRVKYFFESFSSYDIIVLNEKEIIQQQQAGESIHLLSNSLIGSGPVRVYIELLGSEKSVIDAESTGSVSFVVKNEGRGLLEDNSISQGDFSIEFPSDFSASPPVFEEYVTGNAIYDSLMGGISGITGNLIPVTGMQIHNCDSRCGDGSCNGNEICDNSCDCDCTDECKPDEDGKPSLCQKLPSDSRPRCYGTSLDNGTEICESSKCGNGQCDYPECVYGFCAIGESCDCDWECILFRGYDDYNLARCIGGTCTEVDEDLRPDDDTSTTVRPTTTTSTLIPAVPVTPPEIRTVEYFIGSSSIFTNSLNEVEVIGKQSMPFIFDITAPYVSIYSTYTVYASVRYYYELRDSIKITVKPPQND